MKILNGNRNNNKNVPMLRQLIGKLYKNQTINI